MHTPLKPLFPFYGSKWRAAKLYGPPKSDTVVEPFAGSAGYSTYWNPKRVILFDVDENIVQVWQYLLRVKAAEVLALPDLAPGQSTDELQVCAEAKKLIGFWLNRGSASPKKTQTEFSRRTERAQLVWSAKARERIAEQLDKLSGWSIHHADFRRTTCFESAHYFVDPPYVDKGRFYRKKLNEADYVELGAWCHAQAQGAAVTVCEGPGATWLPFKPLASLKSTKGRADEYVWTNARE